jgi:hypothetical protein
MEGYGIDNDVLSEGAHGKNEKQSETEESHRRGFLHHSYLLGFRAMAYFGELHGRAAAINVDLYPVHEHGRKERFGVRKPVAACPDSRA